MSPPQPVSLAKTGYTIRVRSGGSTNTIIKARDRAWCVSFVHTGDDIEACIDSTQTTGMKIPSTVTSPRSVGTTCKSDGDCE